MEYDVGKLDKMEKTEDRIDMFKKSLQLTQLKDGHIRVRNQHTGYVLYMGYSMEKAMQIFGATSIPKVEEMKQDEV